MSRFTHYFKNDIASHFAYSEMGFDGNGYMVLTFVPIHTEEDEEEDFFFDELNVKVDPNTRTILSVSADTPVGASYDVELSPEDELFIQSYLPGGGSNLDKRNKNPTIRFPLNVPSLPPLPPRPDVTENPPLPPLANPQQQYYPSILELPPHPNISGLPPFPNLL